MAEKIGGGILLAFLGKNNRRISMGFWNVSFDVSEKKRNIRLTNKLILNFPFFFNNYGWLEVFVTGQRPVFYLQLYIKDSTMGKKKTK